MKSPTEYNKIPRALAKEYAKNWKDSHGSFPGKPEVSPKYWVFNWLDLKELIDDAVARKDSETTLLAAVQIYLGCKRKYVSSKDLKECESAEDFVMLAVPVMATTIPGSDGLKEFEMVNEQVVISEKVISFGQNIESLEDWNKRGNIPKGNIVSKRVAEYFDMYENYQGNDGVDPLPYPDRRIANDSGKQIFSWRVDIDDLFDIYDSTTENKDKQLVFRLGRKFSKGITLISVAYFNGLARTSAPVLFTQKRERATVNRRSTDEVTDTAPALSAVMMSTAALAMTEVLLNDYYPPDPPGPSERSLLMP